MNKLTKEEAQELIRKIMGPPRRELSGEEYDHTWLILNLLEPIEVTNNQNSITEVYNQGGKIFHVHYFTMSEMPMIEEVGDFVS